MPHDDIRNVLFAQRAHQSARDALERDRTPKRGLASGV
jgi:hypothetical protein